MNDEPENPRAPGLSGIPPPWAIDGPIAEHWAPPDSPPEPDGEGLARWRQRYPLTGKLSEHWREIKVTPRREKLKSMSKLKAARRKVEELARVVRTEAFDDWLRNCVVTAQTPAEWTQAATLYASYLRHAARYGNNMGDKRLSKEELATETAWGKMMGSAYMKKRRRAGQYYPVRLKRGA